MSLTEAQRAALTQMLDTASDLDRWRRRAHRVEDSQRGSELAVDDEIFERMAISQLARLKRSQAEQFGEVADVLRFEDVELPEPGPGEARVRCSLRISRSPIS